MNHPLLYLAMLLSTLLLLPPEALAVFLTVFFLCWSTADHKEKSKKSPTWLRNKKVCKLHNTPVSDSDRVYLQMRSMAWGVRLWQGRSNWRRETRWRKGRAPVMQRPLRGGGGSLDPGRGRGFGGRRQWKRTSSPIGEIRQECPDFFIQFPDITLGK